MELPWPILTLCGAASVNVGVPIVRGKVVVALVLPEVPVTVTSADPTGAALVAARVNTL